MPTPIATSSRIRPRSDHGNANSGALPVASSADWASGMVPFGQPDSTSTCAVSGPTGNSPETLAVTRTESPGRITGTLAGCTVADWPNGPVIFTAGVALCRTFPVLVIV